MRRRITLKFKYFPSDKFQVAFARVILSWSQTTLYLSKADPMEKYMANILKDKVFFSLVLLWLYFRMKSLLSGFVKSKIPLILYVAPYNPHFLISRNRFLAIKKLTMVSMRDSWLQGREIESRCRRKIRKTNFEQRSINNSHNTKPTVTEAKRHLHYPQDNHEFIRKTGKSREILVNRQNLVERLTVGRTDWHTKRKPIVPSPWFHR